MKQKILFVLDYPHIEWLKEATNNPDEIVNTYFDSKPGKALREIMRESFTNAGVTEDLEYHVTFAYPIIPDVIKENKRDPALTKYKKPTVSQVNKYKQWLFDKIVEYDPTIIIPMGGNATKSLLNKSSITKVQGQPTEITVNDSYNYWVYPTFSASYLMVKPDVTNFVREDLTKIGNFLVKGDDAFATHYKTYTVLNNDFDKVVAVFKEALQHGKTYNDPVVFDYETNSLKPEYDGSKILTISLAWQGNDGVTLPIDHPDMPWPEDEYKKLIQMLKLFLNSDIWKLGHNVQYDELVSKQVIDKNITFKNTLDSMVGYFLGVSQTAPKGLKKVAYEFTQLGDYEAPLNDFKDWFTLFLKDVHKVRQDKREPIEDDDYLTTLTDEDKPKLLKLANELLDMYGTPMAVRNPIDNSKFSYEWIPYHIITQYAAGDVDVTSQVHQGLLKNYLTEDKPRLLDLYLYHYPKLLDVLSNIEAFGMQLNRSRLEEMMVKFDEERERLIKEIRSNPYVQQVEEHKAELYEQGLEEKAKPVAERDQEVYKNYNKYKGEGGTDFNPSSKDDVQLALYGYAGIKLPSDDKYLNKSGKELLAANYGDDSVLNYTSYTTGKEAMEYLTINHPDIELVSLLQEYNKINKLRTTYTQSLLDKADSKDVIHGKLNAVGTATGRLSSSDPNL